MTNLSLKLSILIIHGISATTATSDAYCSFMNIHFHTNNWYSCDVSNNLSISTPNAKIASIHGFPSSGKSLSDVKGLSIVNKQTEYLPINLGTKFTNLLALRVKDGRLKKIDQDDLKSMSKLRYVDFESNGLEVIEKELFRFNPQLDYVSFDGNRIKCVGDGAFGGLRELKVLDMSTTSCIRAKASTRFDVSSVVAKIMEKCTDLTEEAKYYRWKIEMFVQKNSKLRAECNEVDGKIAVGDEKLRQFEEAMKKLKVQDDKNQQSFDVKFNDSTRIEGQLKDNISDLELKLSNKKAENLKLEENMRKLKQDIQETQQNINQESQKIQQQHQQTEDLTKENTNLSAKLEILKNNKTSLDKENEELNKEYTAIKSSEMTPENSSSSHEFLLLIVPVLTLVLASLDGFTTLNFFRTFSILRMKKFVKEMDNESECVQEVSQGTL